MASRDSNIAPDAQPKRVQAVLRRKSSIVQDEKPPRMLRRTSAAINFYAGFENQDEQDIASMQDYPRGPISRNICLVVLALAWISGIFAIIFGAVEVESTFRNRSMHWWRIDLNIRVKEFMPLFLNSIVTLLEVGLGLIHTTKLRWALADRLTFNSNLRLFTRSQKHWCFGICSNFFSAGCLALSYAAASRVFSSWPNFPQIRNHYFVPYSDAFIAPEAIVALGIGITGQAALCTWQLCMVKVPTWEGSSVHTAWAMFAERYRRKRPGRALMGIQELNEDAMPQLPVNRQIRSLSCHREVKIVLWYLWGVVVLCFVWFALVIGLITRWRGDHDLESVQYRPDWSFLPSKLSSGSYLQIGYQTGSLAHTLMEPQTHFTVSLLLSIGCQSFLSMALHCTELIVNISRDEAEWRRMAGKRGWKDRIVVVAVLHSWTAIVLLIAKPVLHWMFSMAMQYYHTWGIFFRPTQILYLGIGMLLLAVFATGLTLHRPNGQQPATFGHLQTMMDLIDFYDKHLFWGDKTAGGFGSARGFYNGLLHFESDVRHAGTWSERLPPLQHDMLYA